MKKILLLMLSLIVSVGVSAETKSLNWSSEGSWSSWDPEFKEGVKQEAYAKCDNGTLTFKGQWKTIQYWMQGLADGYGRLTVTLTDNAPYDLYVEAAYSEGNSNGTIAAGQKSVSIDLIAGKTIDKILFKGGSNWPTDQEASVTISTIDFSKPDFSNISITMENAGDKIFKILGSAFGGLDGNSNVNLSVNNSNSETKWFGGKICDTQDSWKSLVDLSQNIPTGNSKITFKVSDFTSNEMPDGYVYIQYWGENMTLAENIEVEQNKITIPLTAAGIGSMILPFAAAIPQGMKVYAFDSYDNNGVLKMKSVEAIAANTPYIIKGEAKDYEFVGVAEADNFQYTVENLTGTYEDIKAPVGTFVLVKKGENEAGFYRVAEGEQPTVKAHRAYLSLPQTNNAKQIRLQFDDETTGIECMNAIKSVGATQAYNLAGQRVSADAKGIVIMNGKKFLVK